MKTYLEWHYDEKPRESEPVLVAYRNQYGVRVVRRAQLWHGRWVSDGGHTIAGNVYAWAPWPIAPQEDPNKA